eukprot:Amastigsp_a181579_4.p4 type:complete len:102 gc:universal Amastigsp_a181579_4:380-75(-)
MRSRTWWLWPRAPSPATTSPCSRSTTPRRTPSSPRGTSSTQRCVWSDSRTLRLHTLRRPLGFLLSTLLCASGRRRPPRSLLCSRASMLWARTRTSSRPLLR